MKTISQSMSDTSFIPFFRSFLLGRSVELNKISQLSKADLDILNVETLAALNEARHNHELIENKQSEDGSTEFRRMKVAGYFQAAIKIELAQR
jgi:hypothetical protein